MSRAHHSRRKRIRLTAELLEDRCVPALFGVPWPDANLRISFAPDGTDVDGESSVLFKTLDAEMPTAAWQKEILRAFQTWAEHGNVNLSVVNDGGQALGADGAIQGDSRFGEIRVAARPLSAEVLAIATPFNVHSTWAGDIILNSNYRFGDSTADDYDLYSVVIQEAGHALGIDTNANPESVMYPDYKGVRTELSADDIAALQSLYGSRSHDEFENNDSFSKAEKIKLHADKDNDDDGGSISESLVKVIAADITTHQDRDFYKIYIPNDAAVFAVRLHTSGQSLLMPRLTVYNSKKMIVESTVSPEPANGDLIISLENSKKDKNYYVSVEGAADKQFAIGAYQLEIDFRNPSTESNDGKPTLLNGDANTNDTLSKATKLSRDIYQTNQRFDYVVNASFHDLDDVDVYRIYSPHVSSGDDDDDDDDDGGKRKWPIVMTAMVWSVDVSGAAPQINVYDSSKKLVPAEVLENEGGSYVIRVFNPKSNSKYYVEVSASSGADASSGNYLLGVDFRFDDADLENFAEGTLSEDNPDRLHKLDVASAQLFQMNLSSQSANRSVKSAVRINIFDASGNLVFSMVARDGKSNKAQVLLKSGAYYVYIAGATKNGEPLPNLHFELKGLSQSDPVGPEAEDPTMDPPSEPPEPPPDYTWKEDPPPPDWLDPEDPNNDPWA